VLLGGAGVAVVLVGLIAGIAPRPSPAPIPRPSASATATRDDGAEYQHLLDSPDRLSAASWFLDHPDGIPAPFSANGPVTPYTGLVGPRVLPLQLSPATSEVLVYLVCSAPDTPYRLSIQGTGSTSSDVSLGGAVGSQCRGLTSAIVAVPREVGDLTLRVRVAPGIHYSLAVYEH